MTVLTPRPLKPLLGASYILGAILKQSIIGGTNECYDLCKGNCIRDENKLEFHEKQFDLNMDSKVTKSLEESFSVYCFIYVG